MKNRTKLVEFLLKKVIIIKYEGEVIKKFMIQGE